MSDRDGHRGRTGRSSLAAFLCFLAWTFFAATLLPALAAAEVSASDAPWRQVEPFGLSPAELQEATTLPADHPLLDDSGVVVLFQNTSYAFDESGRLTQHRHWIYRILDAEAIPDWSKSQVRWAPWRQDRPRIRARVVDAAGVEHWLDPEGARDRQAPETADRRAGERLLTEAPLPAVAAGVVIEEYIVLVEHTPEWQAGTTHRHYTALLAPTLDGRLTLEASTRLALRYGVRRMPDTSPSLTTVEDGRVRVVFDFDHLPAISPPQDGAPGYRPRFPQIAFSTGRSWQSVATAFSQLVDQSINTAELLAIGEDLRGSTGLKAEPRITAILEAMRTRVGFNGFEIGARALDFDVDRTLVEGEGDSLTLAIATVAAMRRAGFEAQVALVKTGFGIDVEPQLPGIGLFNHALVHLGPPGEPGLWLEPSARYVRAGELTLAMQDRFALIASPATRELTRTPATEPEENLAVEVREIFFADFGPGRLVERCRYFGSAERTQRRITGSLDAESRRRGYSAYVNAFHMASRLGTLEETDPLDLSGPFELELEALDSSRIRTDVESAVLEVPVRELARRLPPVLLEDSRPRTEEYVFPEPFVSEWRYEVHPPAGFRLSALPPAETVTLGPARFEQSWRVEDGVVVGDLRFDVGQRLLAPAQFEALRAALGPFLDRTPSIVRFTLESSHRDAGLPALLDELRQATVKEPERASHRIRWALGLLRAGLGVEARLQSRRAVDLQPEWGLAHWAYGFVLMHDEAGVPFGGGAELDEARRALEEAVRRMPDEARVLAALARLDERDARGARYHEGASLDQAATAYQKACAELEDPLLHRDRLRLLLAAGRWGELGGAIELAERALQLEDAGAGTSLLGNLLDESSDDRGFDHRALDAFRLIDQQMSGEGLQESYDAATRRRATVELAAARRYEAAAALASGTDEALATRLARAGRFEEIELHPQDPATPLRSLLVVMRFERPQPEAIAEWLREGFGPKDAETLFFELRDLVPVELDGVALPPPARADLALADLEISPSGAPHLGYRLELAGRDKRFFITLRGDDLRLGGFASRRATLGAEALKRLGDGDLPGAQQWLDWARAEAAEPGEDDDPLAFSPFDRLWPAAPPEELRPADDLRTAAAALAAPLAGREALELLHRAEERSPGELTLEVALLDAYASAGEFLDLESHAGSLQGRFPSSNRAFTKRLEALAALEQWTLLEEAARARLDAGHGGDDARRVLAGIAVDRGRPQEAADLLREMARDGEIEAADAANLLLLMQLEEPKPVAEARALVESTRELGERDARWWRAVAAWRVDEGRIDAARHALARSIELSGGRLQLPDAYIVARLAETCGLPETAEQLYRRLETEQGAALRAPLFRLLALEQLR